MRVLLGVAGLLLAVSALNVASAQQVEVCKAVPPPPAPDAPVPPCGPLFENGPAQCPVS